MNLIILHANEVADNRAVITDDRARHIRKVLRAAPGKELRVGLLNGPLGVGTVVSVDRHEVVLNCVFEDTLPPRPKVDLLLAMPRPKVLKRMWAQLAALGVGKIVLLRAEKVERCYFDSHVIQPDFYSKLLVEGLQQARCTHLPEVFVKPLFKPFVEDELDGMFAGYVKLLADPSGEQRLPEMTFGGERTLLAVGPEGGWTSYELNMLKQHGFKLFGMGKRILRTDTAAIGLLSILNELIE